MDKPWLITVHDTMGNEKGTLAQNSAGAMRYSTKITDQFIFLCCDLLQLIEKNRHKPKEEKEKLDTAPEFLFGLSKSRVKVEKFTDGEREMLRILIPNKPEKIIPAIETAELPIERPPFQATEENGHLRGPWLVTVHDAAGNEKGTLASNHDRIMRYGTKMSEQFNFLRKGILAQRSQIVTAPQLLTRLSSADIKVERSLGADGEVLRVVTPSGQDRIVPAIENSEIPPPPLPLPGLQTFGRLKKQPGLQH
jgi:hypothetical protein